MKKSLLILFFLSGIVMPLTAQIEVGDTIVHRLPSYYYDPHNIYDWVMSGVEDSSHYAVDIQMPPPR